MGPQSHWAQQPLITDLEEPAPPDEEWEVRSQATVFAQHNTMIPALSSDSARSSPITSNQTTMVQHHTIYFVKLIFGSLIVFSCLGILGYLILLLGHQFLTITQSQESTFSLLWGSIVSAASCLIVITDFRLNVPTRRHPAPIIYWRTISDFCCATIFICANTRALIWNTGIDCHSGYGLLLGATVELLFLSSEGWFCVLIADLVTSLTNPFADYRANMRGYHFAVWILGGSAFIGMVSSDCGGSISEGLCWLKLQLKSEHWAVNKCLWSFYIGWVFLFYGYGIFRLLHAKFYLIGKGSGAIEETRSARRLVVDATFSSLVLYMAYLALCGTAAAALAPDNAPNSKRHGKDTVAHWSSHAIAYLFAARGFVDVAVWFSFKHEGLSKDHSKSPRTGGDDSFVSDVSSVTLEELDLDLSPQLNPVLRSEIVSNVTTGIRKSVERHIIAVAAYQATSHLPGNSSSMFNAQAALIADVVDLTLPSGVRFQDHHPAQFALIRKSCGLLDMEYVSQVERITAEKLSEGKSGAFMFFSRNGKFIIKTLELHEANTLHGMLHRYADYLEHHKGSLLSKYLGSHTLSMYGQVFHFIVMQNVFRDAQTINARYDIKGSWVNRSATPATPGARARCRHCREPYIVGKAFSVCRGRTEHEPDVVLKDNDFKTKVSLRPEQAISLISRLEEDSNFLCSEGIMDYSLLLGVQHINFTVNPHSTLRKQAVRRRESLRQSYVSQGAQSSSRLQRQGSNASSTLEAAQMARLHLSQMKRGTSNQSVSSSQVDPNHHHHHQHRQRRRSRNAPTFDKLESIMSPIEHPPDLPSTPETTVSKSGNTPEANRAMATTVLDETETATDFDGSELGSALPPESDIARLSETPSAFEANLRSASFSSQSGLPPMSNSIVMSPTSSKTKLAAEDVVDEDGITRDDILKIGPLSRHNLLQLTRGDSTMLRESGWDNTWDFDENASEVTSDASAHLDVLPNTVTDFDSDYTGFMQPDPIPTPVSRSQSRVSEAEQSIDFNQAPDENPNSFGNGLIVDDEESLQLLAQLRDPTSPIFQTRVVVGPGLFYVGIVDTLETWSLKKRLERWWKRWFTLSRPEDEHGLSCIPPEPYSERFKLKIRDIVEHDFIRQLPSC